MKYILIIGLCIIIFVSGLIAGINLKDNSKNGNISPTPTPIIIRVETKTNTIIKYVSKEVDPKTGQQEKTDLEVNTKQQEMNVKVNDQEFTIKPTVDENYLLENGKIVIDQLSSYQLNLTLPEPKRGIELGGYIGTDGIGVIGIIPKKKGSFIPSVGINYDGSYEIRLGMTF